jgi:hypothetical protein
VSYSVDRDSITAAPEPGTAIAQRGMVAVVCWTATIGTVSRIERVEGTLRGARALKTARNEVSIASPHHGRTCDLRIFPFAVIHQGDETLVSHLPTPQSVVLLAGLLAIRSVDLR